MRIKVTSKAGGCTPRAGRCASGLFVEVGSRYRLRRTERGSRSSGCGGFEKILRCQGGGWGGPQDPTRRGPGDGRRELDRKSTSIKILSQVERPTEGEVGIPGERVTFYGSGYARSSGMAIV